MIITAQLIAERDTASIEIVFDVIKTWEDQQLHRTSGWSALRCEVCEKRVGKFIRAGERVWDEFSISGTDIILCRRCCSLSVLDAIWDA